MNHILSEGADSEERRRNESREMVYKMLNVHAQFYVPRHEKIKILLTELLGGSVEQLEKYCEGERQ